jgi:hypothetical protein
VITDIDSPERCSIRYPGLATAFSGQARTAMMPARRAALTMLGGFGIVKLTSTGRAER